MTEARAYRYRYTLEDGSFIPPPTTIKSKVEGVSLSESNHGYADELIIISVCGVPGEQTYCILTSKDGGGFATRDELITLRNKLDHWIRENPEGPIGTP